MLKLMNYFVDISFIVFIIGFWRPSFFKLIVAGSRLLLFSIVSWEIAINIF